MYKNNATTRTITEYIYDQSFAKHDDLLTSPSQQDVQSRQLWSCASGSPPSEARKRGSGGGSPRKHDNLPKIVPCFPGGPPPWLASLEPSYVC
jgi:hypothetical protein